MRILAVVTVAGRKDDRETHRGEQGRQVVYFFLGSMLGFDTASAVAKMALLDFQSYIGAKYAYERVAGFAPISLFVDELADVVTPEFIGVLNKSRGAAVRITMCGQTSADLEAALRSRAHAAQILGNANTVVQFRAQNPTRSVFFAASTGISPTNFRIRRLPTSGLPSSITLRKSTRRSAAIRRIRRADT